MKVDHGTPNPGLRVTAAGQQPVRPHVVETGRVPGFLSTEPQKETDVHMIYRTGHLPVDLDKVIFRGVPIRQWNRDELAEELAALGVEIDPNGGRDGLAIAYHDWRSRLDHGG